MATEPTPTDAEMMALAHEVQALGLEDAEQALVEYTKRALARWGAQPAPAASPVPLTDPQLVACIKAAGFKTWDSRMWALKREIESLHGITKGT